MTVLEQTINAVEVEALRYAISVAYNCDNLADFIQVMQERQMELLKEEQLNG